LSIGAAGGMAVWRGAGLDSGRGSGVRTFVRGFALPTACTIGRKMPIFLAGWMASRGAEVVDSAFSTMDPAAPLAG
jgi:hypothetical protein